MIYKRPNKKAFFAAIVISLCAHVFALTVLFVKPEGEAPPEFKELKIRLGVKHRQVADNKNLSGRAGLGSPSLDADLPIGELPSLGSRHIVKKQAELAQPVLAPEPKEKPPVPKEKMAKNAPAKKDGVPEKQAGIRQEFEPAARELYVPPVEEFAVPPPHDDGEGGREIGNAADAEDVGDIGYTKMLSRWILQYKKYPEQARLLGLEGEGVIRFMILRNGEVVKKQVMQSTGEAILDRALIRAVEDANPVISVPADYLPEKKFLTYDIKIGFYKDEVVTTLQKR